MVWVGREAHWPEVLRRFGGRDIVLFAQRIPGSCCSSRAAAGPAAGVGTPVCTPMAQPKEEEEEEQQQQQPARFSRRGDPIVWGPNGDQPCNNDELCTRDVVHYGGELFYIKLNGSSAYLFDSLEKLDQFKVVRPSPHRKHVRKAVASDFGVGDPRRGLVREGSDLRCGDLVWHKEELYFFKPKPKPKDNHCCLFKSMDDLRAHIPADHTPRKTSVRKATAADVRARAVARRLF